MNITRKMWSRICIASIMERLKDPKVYNIWSSFQDLRIKCWCRKQYYVTVIMLLTFSKVRLRRFQILSHKIRPCLPDPLILFASYCLLCRDILYMYGYFGGTCCHHLQSWIISSIQVRQAIISSEMLVLYYQPPWRHIPQTVIIIIIIIIIIIAGVKTSNSASSVINTILTK